MKSIRYLSFTLHLVLSISLAVAITACGGGGGGGGNSNPPPIVVDPPDPVLVKPDYQGITTISDILPQDSANLSFDLTSALDFLNLLAFSGTVEYFLIHPSEENSQSSDDSNEIVCESGSVTTTEITANEELSVDYDNCVQEGIRLNGSLAVYLVRLRDFVLHDMDIVADLTMEDLTSSELLTISGYIKVREGTGNFETTATYQIMFQNESNEQIYFDDLMASIDHHEDDRGIDYQGDVYFSELGKFTISTLDLFNTQENGQRLEISGNNSIVLDIYIQDQIIITYSENTIPQSISLIDPPASLFDDTNELPTALISANSYTTDRNVEITLSSRDSSDPDYDVLSFSWDIISAPQGSVWSITQTVDTIFSGDLPGNYSLRLVIDDNQSSAVETTRVITVEKGLPNGSINILTTDITIDDSFRAQIVMDNDQYDRPFEYRLAYSPSGMQIDQDGLITWTAHIPDFGVVTDVNFAVEVLNSDKNMRIVSSTSVASGPNHEITKLHTTDVFNQIGFYTEKQTYRDLNNREYFTAFVSPYTSSNIPYEYLLDENDNIQSGWAILSIPENYKYAAKYDVDNDGVFDHFLTRFNDDNDITNRNELWLMNGATKELSLFAAHQNDVWGTFIFKDMNSQAGVELLAYNQGDIIDVVVYSIDNIELLYQSTQPHGELVGFCDFNSDGIDEVISESNIVDLVKDEQLVVLEDLGPVDLFNSNNENQCSLLINQYGDLSLYKYQNNEFVSLPFSLTTSGGGFDYRVGNFDADNADELLYVHKNVNGDNYWVLVNFENDSTPVEEPITIPDGMEFISQNIITVMDSDGDNIDEILYYNHIHLSKTWNLSSINLSGSTLTTSYTGENNYKGSEYSSMGGIGNFQNDSLTVFYNSIYDASSLVTFSPITSPTETEIPTGEIIGSEKTVDGIFYYTHHTFGANDRYEIIKYADNGSIIWQTEVANDYRNIIIQDIDIGFGLLIISVSGSNPHQIMINTENGDILRESTSSGGYAFLSPDINDTTMIVNGGMKETLGYSDGLLNILFSGLDESWGIDLGSVNEYASFIQYDEDPQLEVLIYYTGPSETQSHQQNYLILDSLTWINEELKRGEQGFIPYQMLIPERELLSCFYLDSSCHNSLKRADYRIEMVDKLTGSIIWHSPYFPSSVGIVFEIDDNNHVNAAIFGGIGIYIFE